MSQLNFFKKDLIRMLGKEKWRIFILFFSKAFLGLFWYRIDRSLYLLLGKKYRFFRLIFTPLFYLLQAYTNIDIHYEATIGPGILILHPSVGIVISGQAKIGANLTLTGGNVIGMSSKKGFYIIGNNCSLGANACIIGPLKLGDNISIGAMACVIKTYDADNLTLVSVPAVPVNA